MYTAMIQAPVRSPRVVLVLVLLPLALRQLHQLRRLQQRILGHCLASREVLPVFLCRFLRCSGSFVVVVLDASTCESGILDICILIFGRI